MDVVFSFEGGFGGIDSFSFESLDELGPFGVSALTMLEILWLDIALYAILLLYFDSVWPQNLWPPLRPDFLCSSSFWRKKCGSANEVAVSQPLLNATRVDSCVREPVLDQ